MAAHRYWRVNIRSQWGIRHDRYIQVDGIEFAEADGVNCAVGGSAFATSTYHPSYGPHAAFDGVLGGNGWASNNDVWGAAIGYDFGTPRDIAFMRLAPFYDASRQPVFMYVESSDDMATWEIEWACTRPVSWVYGQYTEFPRPSGTRPAPHWMIQMLRSQSGAELWACAEVSWASGSGFLDYVAEGEVRGAKQEDTQSWAAVVDGDPATYVYTEPAPIGAQFVQAQFLTGADVRLIRLRASPAWPQHDLSPVEGRVWCSDNGLSWAPAWDFALPEGETWNLGELKTFYEAASPPPPPPPPPPSAQRRRQLLMA